MDALVRAMTADLPSIKKRRISVSDYVRQVFPSFVQRGAYQIPPSAVIGWEEKPRGPPLLILTTATPAET